MPMAESGAITSAVGPTAVTTPPLNTAGPGLNVLNVWSQRADGIEDKYPLVRDVERMEGAWIMGVPPEGVVLMRGGGSVKPGTS